MIFFAILISLAFYLINTFLWRSRIQISM